MSLPFSDRSDDLRDWAHTGALRPNHSLKIANRGMLMERQNSLEAIDQSILRILAMYESLDVVELWYEIGEDDISRKDVTQEEVLSRLEFLDREGFVKCVDEPRGHTKWALDRR